MLQQVYGKPSVTGLPFVKKTFDGGRTLKTPLAVFFEDVVALRFLDYQNFIVLYDEKNEEGAHRAERVTVGENSVIVEPIVGEFVFKSFYPFNATLVAVPVKYEDILYLNKRYIIFRALGYGIRACRSYYHCMTSFVPLSSPYNKDLPKRVIERLKEYAAEETLCVRYDHNGEHHTFLFAKSDLKMLAGVSAEIAPGCRVHFYEDSVAYDGPFGLNFAVHSC